MSGWGVRVDVNREVKGGGGLNRCWGGGGWVARFGVGG